MTNGGRAMHIRGRVVFVCNTSQVSEHWEKREWAQGKQSRLHRPATFRLPLSQIYLSTLEHSRQTKQQQAPYTIDANLISSVTKTRFLEAAASSKGSRFLTVDVVYTQSAP
jgi:hypothetical protein